MPNKIILIKNIEFFVSDKLSIKKVFITFHNFYLFISLNSLLSIKQTLITIRK